MNLILRISQRWPRIYSVSISNSQNSVFLLAWLNTGFCCIKMTGANSGAGTSDPFKALFGEICVSKSFVFCVVFCWALFVFCFLSVLTLYFLFFDLWLLINNFLFFCKVSYCVVVLLIDMFTYCFECLLNLRKLRCLFIFYYIWRYIDKIYIFAPTPFFKEWGDTKEWFNPPFSFFFGKLFRKSWIISMETKSV